jgi:hypothetical protein
MAEQLGFDIVLEDPEWHAAVEEVPLSEAPFQRSFIYHPGGVHAVPANNIWRDLNCPIIVRPTAWSRAKHVHNHFTAASILEDRAFCLDSIVVVHNDSEEHNANSRAEADKVPRRVMWCIRVSVIGGCTAFHYGFGENFLWQIPSSVCSAILAKLHGLGPSVAQLLESEWAPNAYDFKLSEWPDLVNVTRIRDYYDLIFAMSVRPCVGAAAHRRENAPAKPKPFKFPPPKAVNWSLLPCDLARHVIGIAAVKCAMSEKEQDWNAFLGMRLVCKEWRDEADSAAVARAKEGLKLVKHAIQTGELSDIITARTSVLGARLSTIPLICDAAGMSVYNLMRLRRSKPPTELPPGYRNTARSLSGKKQPPSGNRRCAKKRVRFISAPGTDN